MSSSKKTINIVELLEKRGFYEVLYSVALENKTRWIDIVYTVQKLKGAFSPTTIRQRLEDLQDIGFIEKKEKQKARAEYTYHATASAKKYASSIKKMIEETKEAKELESFLVDDPELVREVIDRSIQEGYESPQDFIKYLVNETYKKLRKKDQS